MNNSGPMLAESSKTNGSQLVLLRKWMDSNAVAAKSSKYHRFELDFVVYRRNSEEK